MKIDHIVKSEEFKEVLDKGRRIKSAVLAVYMLDEPGGSLKIGVILPKKNARQANKRNYIKRVIYAYFRENCAMTGKKVVVRLNRSVTEERKKTIGPEIRAELSNFTKKTENK